MTFLSFTTACLKVLSFNLISSTSETFLEICQTSKMELFAKIVNPLSANPTKWTNTLKQFVGNMLANCFSVFDHFVGLALKGLKTIWQLVLNASLYLQLNVPKKISTHVAKDPKSSFSSVHK